MKSIICLPISSLLVSFFNTTNAFGTSPATSSRLGITAASAIDECDSSKGLQFSRRHLPPVRLDQLFESIHYEEPALIVTVTNITGAQPAIRIDHFCRRLRISEIAFHYLWATYPDLTLLIRAKLSAGRVVNNLALGVGKAITNGAGLLLFGIGETRVREGANLGQPVAVSYLAGQTRGAGARNIVGEWCGATENQSQAGQIVIVDFRSPRGAITRGGTSGAMVTLYCSSTAGID